jgi:hypothetical protein
MLSQILPKFYLKTLSLQLRAINLTLQTDQ